MKKTLVTLGMVAVVGFFMVTLMGCPTPVGSSSTTTSTVTSSSAAYAGPFLTIYVSLLPAASNMIDTLNNITNQICIIGGFGSNLALSTDPTKIFADWSLTETRTALTFVSNANGVPLYMGKYANIATNNFTVNFKFINGTPGESLSWANGEKSGNGNEINNRPVNLLKGSNVTLYLTNQVVINGNNVDLGTNGIETWAGVNPTYTCSNVQVTVICTNTTAANVDNATNYAFVGSDPYLSVSTTNSWGDITGRNDQRLVTEVGNILSLTYTMNGSSAIAVKLMVRNAGAWSWGDGNNVQSSFGIPIGQKTSGKVTNIYANPAVVW